MGALPAGLRRAVGVAVGRLLAELTPTEVGRWRLRRAVGPAEESIDRPWPEPLEPSVWVLEPTGAALVLGSTQALSSIDGERAGARGVNIVRRRSGGGAVLVEPGAQVWVDVLVPAGDPRWEVDVSRAFAWLGRAWVEALAAVGVAAVAHDGPLLSSPWSRTVCFAGLGPGEVTVGGAKVVGICQRRTRFGSLFQCAALLRWEPDRILDVLALDDARRGVGMAALAGVAQGIHADPTSLLEAFLGRLE